MNKYFLKIKQEWERSLLAIIGLLLLVGLGWFGYSMLSDEGGSTSQAHTLPAMPDYIDTRVFAFVTPPQLEKNVNPMAFRKKLPLAFITPPTPPKPGGGTAVKPPDPPKPGTTVTPPGGKKDDPKTTTTQTKPPDTPPKPKPPPRKITVQYRGMYKGVTERELAFITAADSKTKKTDFFYLETREKVFDALSVKSFGPNQVVLDYGDNLEVTVPIGTKKEIVLE